VDLALSPDHTLLGIVTRWDNSSTIYAMVNFTNVQNPKTSSWVTPVNSSEPSPNGYMIPKILFSPFHFAVRAAFPFCIAANRIGVLAVICDIDKAFTSGLGAFFTTSVDFSIDPSSTQKLLSAELKNFQTNQQYASYNRWDMSNTSLLVNSSGNGPTVGSAGSNTIKLGQNGSVACGVASTTTNVTFFCFDSSTKATTLSASFLVSGYGTVLNFDVYFTDNEKTVCFWIRYPTNNTLFYRCNATNAGTNLPPIAPVSLNTRECFDSLAFASSPYDTNVVMYVTSGTSPSIVIHVNTFLGSNISTGQQLLSGSSNMDQLQMRRSYYGSLYGSHFLL
jgi:hypothetical protein